MKITDNLRYFRLLLSVMILAGCGASSGPAGDESSGSIKFMMPNIYYDYSSMDFSSGSDIPSGKNVVFYTISDISGDVISADATIYSGVTGSGEMRFTLPDSLVDQSRYIFAVVVLSGSFDLQGKSKTELQAAIVNGEILFGKLTDTPPSGNSKTVTLTKGLTISDFTFIGKAESPGGFIHFTLPDLFYDYTSSDFSSYASIPDGKEVKFYTISDISGETVSADSTIYAGTTGNSDIIFTLPDSLVDQSRYIFAVVVLSGSFDLQGKSKTELQAAIVNGEILFGKVTDTPPSGNSKTITMTKGLTISDFTFIGEAD